MEKGHSTHPAPFVGIPLAAFCSGMAAVVLQTLLFRSFFTVFDGNEWSVSLFFFSWLLWGAAGAVIARIIPASRLREKQLPLLLLAYLPAGLLQFFIMNASRRMLGVAAFDIFTGPTILPGILLANAPASLVSGILFMALVRYSRPCETRIKRPATVIYTWEALGSFAAGAGITALLYRHYSAPRIFLLLMLLLSAGSLLLFRREKAGRRFQPMIPAFLFLLAGAMLAAGLDQRIARALDRRAWSALMPDSEWRGGFSTAANRYLYGVYQNQFNVVAGTSVIESVPNRDDGERLALMLLAQQPDAGEILLIGPGLLPAAGALTERQPTLRVTWLNPDEEYASRLLTILPETGAGKPRRLITPTSPVRRFLQTENIRFDAAVIRLSADDTMANSILFTDLFLRLVKERLKPEGCLYMSGEGGENYSGRERLLTGAVIDRSLSRCFANQIAVPGDPPWFAASDSPALSGDPEELAKRLRGAYPDWSGWPPEMLRDLYQTHRAAALQSACSAAAESLGPALEHTVPHPKLTLFSTLIMLRKAMPNMPDLTPYLPILMYAPFLLLLLLSLQKLLPALKPQPTSAPTSAPQLILFAGFSGFTFNYMLLILFQAFFGTLYLRMGLLTALFMLGLYSGGRGVERLMDRTSISKSARLVLGLYLAVSVGLYLLPFRPAALLFDLFFFLAGCCTAGFIPIAEKVSHEQGADPERTGLHIAAWDYLGGAAAALSCGLLTLPLLGIPRTLLLLALTAAGLLLPAGRRINADTAVPRRPGARWIPVALFLCAALCLLPVQKAKEARTQPIPEAAQRFSSAVPDPAGSRSAENNPDSIPAARPLPGVPRTVNSREIRAMIERGELSDQPARYALPLRNSERETTPGDEFH